MKEGDVVNPRTVVARTELPGIMQTVKLAERLGVEVSDVQKMLMVHIGDAIKEGDVLAESKGLFGRFFRSEVKSPCAGTVELLSSATGNLGIRQPPTPIEKDAYVEGTITKVIPTEGVVVSCNGALIQGIFGVGGERLGTIQVATATSKDPLTDANITPAHTGKILIGGGCVTGAALRKAAECGVLGIVCGGVIDRELMDYLAEALKIPGFDIGVAITGHEPIPFTLMLTEGFGEISMAERSFKLLQSLEGKTASINGATQIRAGVIRPEIVVPLPTSVAPAKENDQEAGQLTIGTPIRVIREPYFGILGNVTGLPSELTKVESETMVRVLEAKLNDGRIVTVPRANVEIIETV